jgi:SAM-dependent methyltransferase
MTSSYSVISLSHGAPRYNRIDALPDAAAADLGEALARLAIGDGVALDMGCGAGRVAIPAAGAGLPVVGVDLDATMLGEAIRAVEGLPFNVARGTILHLPFAEATFATVLAINVLHLIPEWRAVLDEVVRVLRPGGILVQGRDWVDPDSCAGRLQAKLREVVAELEPGLQLSATAPTALTAVLSELGGVTEPDLVAASWDVPVSPAELLRQMAAQAHSETGMLSDALLEAALERLRAWVIATWADPEQLQPVARRFHLIVTRGLK